MSERTALKIVFCLALLGTAFSGALSYIELSCAGAASCPAVALPGVPLLSYPACVYGFGMFIILTCVSGYGLYTNRKV